MILVDTSVWVLILRDKTGSVVAAFRRRVGMDITVLSRFSQLELLQGAKDSKEWQMLEDYLSAQVYLEASADTWREAARIYFELRRKGITLSSPVDCCIAQIASENHVLLLHCDQDFGRIATVRKIDQEYFSWQ
jgi:predicted nucleic acid-binding protein